MLMVKEKFLNTLFEYICVLPEDQIEETLSYYSEIIDDYKENGLSEEEAIQKIGDVKEIANKTLEAYVGKINPEGKLSRFISNIFKLSNSKWRLLIFAILVFGFPIWVWIALPILILLLIIFVCIFAIPILLLHGSVMLFWIPFMNFGHLNALKLFWNIGMSLVCFGGAAFYISCFTTLSKIIFRRFKKLSIKIKKLKFLKKVEK